MTSQPTDMVTPIEGRFAIRLEMLSDWHVGSGAGRPGEVDRLVRRDDDSLPFVPAKSLVGILRDGCEVVAAGLDAPGGPGRWQEWTRWLFGSQPAQGDPPPGRPAALSVRAARYPADLRSALTARLGVREAVTFVKPGVAIDPRTGRAREDFLRFEEMARTGSVLEAQAQLRSHGLDERAKAAATALLVLAATMADRVGGKRRRGCGLCRIEVIGGPPTEAAAAVIHGMLDDPPAPPPPAPATPPPARSADHPGPDFTTEGPWQSVRLHLRLTAPMVVHHRTVGNLVKCLPHVPGTYLLAATLDRLRGLADVDLAARTGALVVTNATMSVDGKRGEPLPLAVAVKKGSDATGQQLTYYNLFVEQAPGDTPVEVQRDRPFVAVPLDGLRALPPEERAHFVETTHNVVQDDKQRPTAEVGGVFTYEAIPAGTELTAEVRVSATLAQLLSSHDRWWSALGGEWRLGRANKDDYGLAVVTPGEPTPHPSTSAVATSNTLDVWLLSDTVLLDDRLRPTVDTSRLGPELERLLGGAIRLRPRDMRLRASRSESWQTRWGLPRASIVGLAAGTCATFDIAEGTLDPEVLTALEASGIGERRPEGFGQVRFNHPLLRAELASLRPARRRSSAPPSLDAVPQGSPSYPFARLLEKEAWRRELTRMATNLAATASGRSQALGLGTDPRRPTSSQLGALRSVIGSLGEEGGRQKVLAWLGHLKATPSRAAAWQPSEAIGKITELVEKDEVVWDLLPLRFDALSITADGADQLRRELWPEAVRALVLACTRAHGRAFEAAD